MPSVTCYWGPLPLPYIFYTIGEERDFQQKILSEVKEKVTVYLPKETEEKHEIRQITKEETSKY